MLICRRDRDLSRMKVGDEVCLTTEGVSVYASHKRWISEIAGNELHVRLDGLSGLVRRFDRRTGHGIDSAFSILSMDEVRDIKRAYRLGQTPIWNPAIDASTREGEGEL